MTPLAKDFISRDPTLIGIVAGVRFYEHPTLGDESTLIAIMPNGKKKISPFWEIPNLTETVDFISECG